MDDLLTSDEDEPIVRPKRERKLKMLGQISLISSDEDDFPKTKKRKPLAKVNESIKSIDLLTSDEDPDEDDTPQMTKKKNATKRKNETFNPYPELSEDSSSEYSPPPKKTKSVAPKVSKKDSTVKRSTKKTSQPKKSKTATVVTAKEPAVQVEVKTHWKEEDLLSYRCGLELDVSQNLIKLLEEGNTIPFIARYRKNITKNMSADELRQAKEVFDDICKLKEKMVTVAKAIKQAGKLDEKLQGRISCVRSLEELEHIYAPYKPENKGTLASRARKLGLENPAFMILNNIQKEINLHEFVNQSVKGLGSVDEVQSGIVHIMSAEIAVDTDVLNYVRDLKEQTRFYLISSEKKVSAPKKAASKQVKTETTAAKQKSKIQVDTTKYQEYFNKSMPINNLKSYQILAINRGEAQKALTVKIDVPEYFNNKYRTFCNHRWKTFLSKNGAILNAAIEDSLTRHIQPLVIRQIRTELTNRAHSESTDIFSTNLKHLLMAPPWKGKHILGMDPGFKNGVKVALISPTGKFLENVVLYPQNVAKNEEMVKDLVLRYQCDTIGIGNGHACRQTEEWVAGLIKRKCFGNINVKYTIVTEDGASIYSCSAEAKKEFGNLDPNIISAVSLARRLQDPLAELVKVEPNHLGIGMYQMDIKKKELEEALNEVVSECVSFVGVDLNTASQCLLKRVAGLSDKKAELIINYRETHGPFTHRKQITDVYGIGEKCFQQCAGFLRITPVDPNDKQFYSKKQRTPLDSTIIHPESYSIARQIISKVGLKEQDIGTDDFVRNFNSKKQILNIDKLTMDLETSKETINLIFDALSKKSDYDMRIESGAAPLFKENITEFSSLKPGMILTGRVVNAVQFGVFVDVGVEQSGLIHVSKMNNLKLNIGDRVEVKVLSIEIQRKRLSLEAVVKM